MEVTEIKLGEAFYVLTAVLVALKLDGAINWSWWFVFSPLLLLAIAIIAILVFISFRQE